MNTAPTPSVPNAKIRPRSALLIISALILAFPKLYVIDLIPDAIACFLLLYVIAPYAVIDLHLAEAQRYLEHMLLISVAQLISVPFILIYLAPSPQEQPMSVLLCCFVFAFFRIKTVIPLTRELGDGLMYLDTRNDGTMFCQSYTRRVRRLRKGKRRVRVYHYSVTDRMMRSVRTFVIATSILNVLPELTALTYIPDDDTVYSLYDFVALLRGFAMIVALIFGVVFVCRAVRFARDIRTDTAYYQRLNALYRADEEAHPERQVQKYLRRTFILVLLFSIFTMDFSLDRINVLPDFIAALLLIGAFWMLRGYVSHSARRIAIALGYAAVSVVHFVFNTRFWLRYNPESIYRSERIRMAYLPVQILSVLEAVMLLAAMIVLWRALCEVIDGYTGYEIEGTANYSREDKLREEHQALHRSLLPVVVAGFATVLSGPLYTFLRPTVEFAWIFSVIIPGIFAVLLQTRLMRIRDGIDSRFLLK